LDSNGGYVQDKIYPADGGIPVERGKSLMVDATSITVGQAVRGVNVVIPGNSVLSNIFTWITQKSIEKPIEKAVEAGTNQMK
jgi:hypothetical protein